MDAEMIYQTLHDAQGNVAEGACPVIVLYVTIGYDRMPDDARQRMIPFLPRIAKSRGKPYEEVRTRILQLAAVRIFLPQVLDATKMHEQATALRALPDNVDMAVASSVARSAWVAAMKVEAWTAATAALWTVIAAGWEVMEAIAWTAATAASLEGWNDYYTVLDNVLNAGDEAA